MTTTTENTAKLTAFAQQVGKDMAEVTQLATTAYTNSNALSNELNSVKNTAEAAQRATEGLDTRLSETEKAVSNIEQALQTDLLTIYNTAKNAES